MSIQPETLAWLRQTAKFEGAVTAQAILHLLERVEALEADATEQSQSSSFCNEAIVKRLEALEQWLTCGDFVQVPPTPEAAPVATDAELQGLFKDQPMTWGQALRAAYGLGRQHGAAAAQSATPAPVVALHDALIKAECALSDIAEGEETNAAPSTFEWSEQRCAETLAIIRPVMKQHKIRTSEWPPTPQPAHAHPLPQVGEAPNV